MRITVTLRSEQPFAHNAFRRHDDQLVLTGCGLQPHAQGVCLVEAVVDDERHAARLTLDVPDTVGVELAAPGRYAVEWNARGGILEALPLAGQEC
jgi:hypothetical protein